MRKPTIVLAASAWGLVATGPAIAGPAEDATAFVTKAIDQFNGGDVNAWLTAQDDDTLIVDEFAPHLWIGSGSAQRWLQAYSVDAKGKGITGGRVDYGKPLQATSDGTTAYIVMPTIYRFIQNGTKMAEPSNMTFVMKHGHAGWKITSWTYSATGPAAAEK